jgi:hypothetical protein
VNKEQYKKLCEKMGEYTLFKRIGIVDEEFDEISKRLLLPIEEKISQREIRGENLFLVVPPKSTVKRFEKIFEEKKVPYDIQKRIENLRKNFSELTKEPSSLHFMLRLTAPSEITHPFKIDKRYKVYKRWERIIGILRECDFESFSGMICAELRLDADKFRPISGLSFPRKLSLTPELISMLGESKLTGISMGFENSPLGVEDLMIIEENGVLSTRMKMIHKFFASTSLEDIVEDAYKHVMEIEKFIVEAK